MSNTRNIKDGSCVTQSTQLPTVIISSSLTTHDASDSSSGLDVTSLHTCQSYSSQQHITPSLHYFNSVLQLEIHR